MFVFDPAVGELQKKGVRIRLQGQPLAVLGMLLERPGQIVSRDDIRRRLWAADTYVDFEHSLNTAVKRLRRALGDSAEKPRYIETFPRRGYRFVAEVRSFEPGTQPGVRSIAVLPFENFDGEDESQYLSDGLAETIISTLARRPGLRVMARSSVFRYRNKTADARAIGRKLHGDAVLTGRIQHRGERLVVAAELVDVSYGWRLWGEHYSSGMTNLYTLQENISREIARSLSPDEQAGADPSSSVDAEAYRDYLKGRYYWNRMTADSLRKATVHFRQAIERDPAFALAYVGLSDSLVLFPFVGLAAPDQAMPEAKRAALHALRIDEGLAEAHASLAGIRKLYEWDWAGAESEYKTALMLDPNYESVHRFYAAYLCSIGRFDEGLAEIRTAHELDPLSLVINTDLAWDYYMSRRYDLAREQALKTLDLEPSFASAVHVLGLACEQMGRTDEAISTFQRALAVSKNPAALAALGHALGRANHVSEAAEILRGIDTLSATGYVPPYWRAVVCAGLGQTGTAIEHLQTSCEQRDVWLVWLKQEPRFDPLRAESGFRDVLEALRMPH